MFERAFIGETLGSGLREIFILVLISQEHFNYNFIAETD